MTAAKLSSRSPRSPSPPGPPARASIGADLADVAALAEWQLENDKERTNRFPDLFARKLQRMSTSPLAFLRGAAPLFFEMLASRAELADGPAGEGWLVGDLHLENFGAYRPEAVTDPEADTKKRPAVFNLNDFDDTLIGPWRLDVLRLMTSLLLGGRELGANGLVALELSDHLIEAWARGAFDGALPGAPPAPVTAVLEQVSLRSRVQLLDARTEVVNGKRRFTRGPRYADLSADVLAEVPRAFDEYIASIPEPERPRKGLGIVDAALRIAGTGSLGGLRVAVLVEGKGGPSGGWIFDLKEQGEPSASALVGVPDIVPAVRVVTGFRACVENPPTAMGTTRIGNVTMSGRRLSPQEDKLNLRKLRSADLPTLATYLGALLGAGHARGATKPPTSAWSKSDREAIRTHAITLAGVHEAVYLALCDRMRRILV